MARRRGHNEGSIYQTADGSLRGALTVTLVDGRTTRRYVRGRTRAEVRRKLAALRDASQRGQVARSRQTLGDYLEDWLHQTAAPALAPGSVLAYERRLADVLPRLGHLPLTAVTPAHLSALYAELLRRQSPSTVHLTHAVLHRALKTAWRWRLIAENPADFVDAPRLRPPDTGRALSREEVRRLARTAAESGDRLAALWVLAVTTGLRRGEAIALRWSDIDLAAARLSVRQQRVPEGAGVATRPPKTRLSRRTLVLSGLAVAALRAHRARQAADQLAAGPAWLESGLIFTRADGAPLHPNAIYWPWRQALARAGLPPLRPHDLRHTAASLLLDDGANLKAVQELLGHSTIRETADIYGHLSHTGHADLAARMDRLLGEG